MSSGSPLDSAWDNAIAHYEGIKVGRRVSRSAEIVRAETREKIVRQVQEIEGLGVLNPAELTPDVWEALVRQHVKRPMTMTRFATRYRDLLHCIAFYRAGSECQYCGRSQEDFSEISFHIDHVVPQRFRERLWDVFNLRVACHVCNHGKRVGTPQQWEAELISLAKSVRRRYPDQFLD